ncbi:fimbrial protein [Photobacterium angustum]|uniref:Major type 1 subunit fimbrin (Pilin) n=1 Tax=Photobacterium angustum (strain S14 / CCUG 15956) TaxID=314292 RepID=Q1ZU80_PHOAS|nr:fimbrial protein [Photobacterium angustum]EAS66530.1 major type 1 subunit fimbrin (pilin) [Photobacterium angustum S14]
MNKKILLSSLAILASFGVASAAFADGPDPITVNGGTVNFKGEITDGACAVDPDSIDQTVQMGQVKAATLQTAGAKSSSHSFNIKLDDCSTATYKNVAMSFLGATDANGSLVLTDAAGSAKNVGIDIYDGANKKVTFDNSTSTTAVQFHNGTNVIPFTANYVSNIGGATAGTANATATFNIIYS